MARECAQKPKRTRLVTLLQEIEVWWANSQMHACRRVGRATLGVRRAVAPARRRTRHDHETVLRGNHPCDHP